jgi:hypothetical protein
MARNALMYKHLKRFSGTFMWQHDAQLTMARIHFHKFRGQKTGGNTEVIYETRFHLEWKKLYPHIPT